MNIARLLLGVPIIVMGVSLALVLKLLITDFAPELSMENWSLALPFLIRSLCYSAITAAGQVVIGLLAALTVLWVTRRPIAQLVLITIFLLPYAIPATVIGLAFRFGLGADSAWSETLSPLFGLPSTYWLYDHPFEGAILASIWQFFPFAFLLCFLALRSIDQLTIRAAQLDGAPFRAMIARIVLARIWPVLTGVFTLRFLFMLVKFDTLYVFTEQIYSPRDVATIELWRATAGSTSPELSLIAWILQIAAFAVALIYAFAHHKSPVP